jgi:hypothetical protein
MHELEVRFRTRCNLSEHLHVWSKIVHQLCSSQHNPTLDIAFLSMQDPWGNVMLAGDASFQCVGRSRVSHRSNCVLHPRAEIQVHREVSVSRLMQLAYRACCHTLISLATAPGTPACVRARCRPRLPGGILPNRCNLHRLQPLRNTMRLCRHGRTPTGLHRRRG